MSIAGGVCAITGATLFLNYFFTTLPTVPDVRVVMSFPRATFRVEYDIPLDKTETTLVNPATSNARLRLLFYEPAKEQAIAVEVPDLEAAQSVISVGDRYRELHTARRKLSREGIGVSY